MKKYTSLNQLITEALDGDFKITKVEDNLLNGLVQKRWQYSYSYPKNSEEIITPQGILDYLLAATGGDAKKINSVIRGLNSPQAVGISADSSKKKGIFGGKNEIEGYVYVFKSVTQSAVNSVNPDQLLNNSANSNVAAFHILSEPRSGSETIQQNLSKIINAGQSASGAASGSTSGSSGVSRLRAGTSQTISGGGKINSMELQVILGKSGASSGTMNGAYAYFTQVVNGLFKDASSKRLIIGDPIATKGIEALNFKAGDRSITIAAGDLSKAALDNVRGSLIKGDGIAANTQASGYTFSSDNTKAIINLDKPTTKDVDKPTFDIYRNHIFLGDSSPVIMVICKFLMAQPNFNKIITAQTNVYNDEIKAALTEIIQNSGDPNIKLGGAYDLTALTKLQLVSIMTAWLVYAANNGIIPSTELSNTSYPTIQKYIDIILRGAPIISATGSQTPGKAALGQAEQEAIDKRQEERLQGPVTIETPDELEEILFGAGFSANSGSKDNKRVKSDLIDIAGDGNRATSAWTNVDLKVIGATTAGNNSINLQPGTGSIIKVGNFAQGADITGGTSEITAINGDTITLAATAKNTNAAASIIIIDPDAKNIEEISDEVGAFNPDGTARIYTPDFNGMHSGLANLRLYLIAAQKAVPQAGQPTITVPPDSNEIKSFVVQKINVGGVEKTVRKIPTATEIAKMKAGYGWGADLEQAILFYRKRYYDKN